MCVLLLTWTVTGTNNCSMNVACTLCMYVHAMVVCVDACMELFQIRGAEHAMVMCMCMYMHQADNSLKMLYI